MQTSINLQEPFTYSVLPLIIAILLLVGLTYGLFWAKKTKKEPKKKDAELKVIPEKNSKNVPVIKNKYLSELDKIENQYKAQKISLRKAYQLISEAIRLFVFEMTDITTQNYSLAEIKKMNIPDLYALIEEYYEPEFASKSIGDFEIAIKKARRVINEWN